MKCELQLEILNNLSKTINGRLQEVDVYSVGRSLLLRFIRLTRVSKYLDFNWRFAIDCLTGGSLRMTPRIAAIALWLKRARLSKMRFCSFPLSMAITTAR
jgi:hypothetical protein